MQSNLTVKIYNDASPHFVVFLCFFFSLIHITNEFEYHLLRRKITPAVRYPEGCVCARTTVPFGNATLCSTFWVEPIIVYYEKLVLVT